jgi:hypothetical protein
VPAPAPRSLADDLRGRSDAALATLVRRRPDLIHPVPGDLGALALRAGSQGSVAAALRDADQLLLHVVLAAALGPDPTTPGGIVAQVQPALQAAVGARAAREQLRAGVAILRQDALLWGTDRALHLVGAARELVVPPDRGPRLAALDPVVAGYVTDPAVLQALLAAAPHGARAALDRLLAGPVVGTVGDARREPDPQRSPVDWLLAHHLIVPMGADRVVVPGEVVALLRGEPPPPVLPLVPPAPVSGGDAADDPGVESAAVGARVDLLHAVAELGARWADEPPSRVRSGALSARDLATAGRALGCTERRLALLVEMSAAAGLLAGDSHDAVTVLPTPAFDAWLREPPAARLAALLRAWLVMPRSALDPELRPLGPEGSAPALPAVRREVLVTLASAPGAWDAGTLLAALEWRAPRRHTSVRAALATGILDELAALGVVVGGRLSATGHTLAAPDEAVGAALTTTLAATLPPVVDTLVLQADLTATVAGLPSPELAALLRLAADAESTGAASVFRFSPSSVRRWLDAGRSAGELLAELGRRGSVPQPLAYLIDDVARRHATLRIGATATYLRCDDPVALAAILADPGAAALGLVPIADTVLVSPQPPEHVLDRLRALGHAPLVDPGSGLEAPVVRRARPRHGSSDPTTPAAVTPALAAAAVRAMRASDRGPAPAVADPHAGTAGRPGDNGAHPVPVGSPAEVVAALRAAITAEGAVWIGYADPSGAVTDRRVEPLRLAGGYLTAMDLRTESIQSFALARITGVQPV